MKTSFEGLNHSHCIQCECDIFPWEKYCNECLKKLIKTPKDLFKIKGGFSEHRGPGLEYPKNKFSYVSYFCFAGAYWLLNDTGQFYEVSEREAKAYIEKYVKSSTSRYDLPEVNIKRERAW